MGFRVGRYETICPIASGGMATVHLARAVGVGGFERLVAVKVMHEHIADEPDFVAMFLDEARLAARIRHPNVVATIDVQQTDVGLFLVMEFVEGPSLRRMLRRLDETGQTMPIDVVVRIFVDALAGLHAAHQLKGPDGAPLHLVHRDVSPANILVGADGVVRLTDFGVARAEARLSSTRGGQLKGKIPYMPPEQIMGEQLDRRADVYAAGVVLWEGLVGRRLFQASNDGELVHRIITGEVEPPRQLRPEIPEALEAVCLRALAKNPNARFDDAAAFADALEDAAADASIRVASSRTVGAFVRELSVHSSSEELIDQGGVPSSATALGTAPGDDPPLPEEDFSVASDSALSTPSGAA
ncbi:MAG: serine/threonine protein kinase, partial [Deltaproteobacteria bacterium]|nr:serine/threonine protein kinase [Deltaproteobacteria bacterium]MBW2534921.1 serine/threonine protein kinase [Deltaproteobacteria bacterium]